MFQVDMAVTASLKVREGGGRAQRAGARLLSVEFNLAHLTGHVPAAASTKQ